MMSVLAARLTLVLTTLMLPVVVTEVVWMLVNPPVPDPIQVISLTGSLSLLATTAADHTRQIHTPNSRPHTPSNQGPSESTSLHPAQLRENHVKAGKASGASSEYR